MVNYIIRRLILMVPTLLGITALVFFVMALSPGGVGGVNLTEMGQIKGGQEAARVRAYYQKRYGLDKPVVVQFVRWLNLISPFGLEQHPDGTLGGLGFKWPSLGESLVRHRPVTELLLETLPVTVLLNLISIPIVYSLGILSGLLAARRRGGVFDVTSGTVFLALWSVPAIWAGVLMIGLLANVQYLNWFPTAGLHSLGESSMTFLPHYTAQGLQPGWLLDTLWHLVLPVVCLSYGGFAFLSKLTRGSILDNLGADFVRTARAKGVSEKDVLFRHVFRNSLLALITVASGIIPSLLGGAVVVETIFSIPGMGKLGVEAVQFRDRELVLAVTFVGGVIGLLCQLLRDVCYAVADPRVSYEQERAGWLARASASGQGWVMTTLAGADNLGPTVEAGAPPAPAQSLARRLLGDTLARWGARLGLVWVVLMVLGAVLGPFLASSHPLLLKMDGQWSSPSLGHLELVDVLLLVGAFWVLALLPVRSIPLTRRVLLVVWMLALLLPAAGWSEGRDVWVQALRASTIQLRLWSCGGLLLLALLDLGLIVVLPRWIGLRPRQWVAVGAVAWFMVVVLAFFHVSPPATVVYEQYRLARRQGRVQFSLGAPLPYSPDDRLRDQPELRLTGPSWAHPLGTTANGADMLANMIYGTRIALSIGFISTGIAVVIGVIIGGLMGYFSGWVDLLGMRLVEIFDAIPTLFLLLAFVAFFTPNLYIMMAIIGITGWVGYAYFVRAEFLRLRSLEFVQAAIAAGLPLRSILFRHMLPNGITPVLVTLSFGVAGAILAESTLSFLGIGLVNESSWGKLLNQALGAGGAFYWWIALFPGLAIFLTVFAYNLIGEALRDAIDPHAQPGVH